MLNTNGNDGGKAKITSLRELAGNITPPRDLWPEINTRLAEQGPGRLDEARNAGSRWHPARPWVFAMAAALSTLAIGLWLGRNFLPKGGMAVQPHVEAGSPHGLQVALVTDPRYVKERAALLESLQQQMKTLPPETQMKVTASLAIIRKSMSDIQAALGREPGNALLQELLVNTYQDEMRVLAAVHEAGDTGQEI